MVTVDSPLSNLEKLGLNSNEAKIVHTLILMGPSGVSDVHGSSGVPRNKIYEILDRFVERGLVEMQPGRPVLFRIANPDAFVNGLVNDFVSAGNEIKGMLAQLDPERGGEDAAYAWVVKGKEASKRRLAELVYSAENDIFMIGGYPSEYIQHVKSALKSAVKRGIKTRAVCMVSPMESNRPDLEPDSVIEWRTARMGSPEGEVPDRNDMKILAGFRDTASHGGVAIIDEAVAFNIVDEGKLPEKVTGILIRAPGAPRIQKGTIARILSKYTRKL